MHLLKRPLLKRSPPSDNTKFQFGYLTKQNAAWAALGVNIFGSKFTPVDLVKDTDELFVVAYPSFNREGDVCLGQQQL